MRRIAVFVHFDKDDIVDDYVVQYLKSLRQAVDSVVFVSASKLSNNELKKVAPYVIHSIVRENIGYDFASYRDGFNWVKEQGVLGKYDEFILCNDSALGGLNSFNHMFNSMQEQDCDFWGVTDSYSIAYHLQSYFLVFRPSVFTSTVFENFLNNVKQEETKDIVIEKYEVGLTQTLLKQGFKSTSFIKVEDLLLGFVTTFFSSKSTSFIKVEDLYNKYFSPYKIFPKPVRRFFTKRALKKDKVHKPEMIFFIFDTGKNANLSINLEYCLLKKSPLLKKSALIFAYNGCFAKNKKNKHKTKLLRREAIKNWNDLLSMISQQATYDVKLIDNYCKRESSRL